MESRTFPRATEPHRATLAAALFPVIGPHFIRFDKGAVFIEAEYGAVTTQAVQALVDAAPAATSALDIKAGVDKMPVLLQAIILSLVDVINVERAQHGRPAITRQVAIDAVRNKVDSLS